MNRERKSKRTQKSTSRAAAPVAAPDVSATSRKTTRRRTAPKVVRAPLRRPTYEEIAQRAYELWEASGQTHGHHVDDWLRAETELLAQ